jgi:hypothetical protein
MLYFDFLLSRYVMFCPTCCPNYYDGNTDGYNEMQYPRGDKFISGVSKREKGYGYEERKWKLGRCARYSDCLESKCHSHVYSSDTFCCNQKYTWNIRKKGYDWSNDLTSLNGTKIHKFAYTGCTIFNIDTKTLKDLVYKN